MLNYTVYINVYTQGSCHPITHTLNTVRPSHPQDLGLAATAGRSEELFVAVFTVDGSVFLHKASVCQRGLAVGAVELLLMPRLPHRYQKRPPDKEETLVTFDFLSVLPEPEQPSIGGLCPFPPSLGATSEDSASMRGPVVPPTACWSGTSPTLTEVLC